MSKNTGGRPRFEVTDQILHQIETLAGYGHTLPQIAAVIGVSERTLHYRKKDQEAVFAALERGKAKAAAIVGKALFEQAKEGNVQAIRWYETTRCGRSDKQVTEISGPDGGAVPIEVKDGISDEERAARLAALLDRARARATGSPAE